MNKLRIATIGVLLVALLVPGVVLAQEEALEDPEGRVRAVGEISAVVPGQGTFTLMTRRGEELEFQTAENTKFRSPNGSIEDIHDLKVGMKALVVAAEQTDGSLLALMVAAGNPEDLPDHLRVAGQIRAVDPSTQTFALETREGETIPFQTGERTKYRGEGIEGFESLKPGMHAKVAALPQEDGAPLAILVAVGEPKERPDVTRLAGEITGVVPGQGTFTLVNRGGEEFPLSTSERTKYHSRDGSIQDIHDLKKGMMAMVGAVRQDSGQLLALVVAVGNPKDRPELDVKVGGEVVALGTGSFTIQTRDGKRLSFGVNENTHYKGISGFGELKLGMMAAVGANETDDGLLAIFIGARNPEDRPARGPQDRPEDGPNRKDPGWEPGQDQDVSA
ncbi:MAG: DUF5666 domain-containing protein [Anaerolineales bacterium]